MIKVDWISDELAEVTIDGEPVITVNHDDHGWQGMIDIIAAVTKIGAHFGATIVTEGTPGV